MGSKLPIADCGDVELDEDVVVVETEKLEAVAKVAGLTIDDVELVFMVPRSGRSVVCAPAVVESLLAMLARNDPSSVVEEIAAEEIV